MGATIAIIVFCAVVGGWSFLSVLGNERQRAVQSRRKDPPASPPPAATP